MPKLGVNIDHVATLRQARREFDPDPIQAAQICEEAGADSIVCHLREDRRHIHDKDILILRKAVKTKFNLELSLNSAIIEIALKMKPDQATIVPERRQEITTEGGLDVMTHFNRVEKASKKLQDKGIVVSLFIAPDKRQIDKTKEAGIPMIELHTGQYALAKSKQSIRHELQKLREVTQYARRLGLTVNAGHGLKYDNTKAVAQIEGIDELNIGHSIISRAIFVGLKQAVQEMLALVK